MDSIKTEIVVIGAGPGGYAAAFYAADLGKKVILIEKEKKLGGVCLNRGCIPSKALLYATHQIVNSRESVHRGITFAEPKVDVAKLREWKDSIIVKLSGGVATLAKMRGVQVIAGRGYFEGSNKLRVETESGQQFVEYEQAILAVGSVPAMPKSFDLGNPRVMTSTEALEIEDIPESLLVVGGGYIGMELGTVYAALGSKIVLVEALDAILAGADGRPRASGGGQRQEDVQGNPAQGQGHQDGHGRANRSKWNPSTTAKKLSELYDRVLVSVGRVPNSADLGLKNTKVELDEKGFVKVNAQQQTSDPAIYAIGDIAGGILLAHKAHREARVAVEVITGESSSFDSVIPAVVFTDPEIAWCGLTEAEAKEKGGQI